MKIIKLNEVKDIRAKNIKMLLYSRQMLGKTTFAATFPKPFIVSTDGNIKGLEDIDKEAQAVILNDVVEHTTDSGRVIKRSGWEFFKEFVDDLIKDDEVETIVIDLIKDVYEIMTTYIKNKLGIIHESEDKRNGRIWNLYDSEFMPVLRKLTTCDKNVIFIAHEKERNGIMTPNIIESLTNKIQSYTDITARLVGETKTTGETKRTLQLTPKFGQFGGNRLGITSAIEDPTYEKLIEILKEEKEEKEEKGE